MRRTYPTKEALRGQLDRAMDRAEADVMRRLEMGLPTTQQFIRSTMRRELLASGVSTPRSVERDMDELQGIKRPSLWARFRAVMERARPWWRMP